MTLNKGYGLTRSLLILSLFITACGSAPKVEDSVPEVVATPVVAPVETPPPKEPSPPTSPLFKESNTRLLNTVEAKSNDAMEEEAHKDYGDYFSALDKEKADLKAKIESDPATDYSPELKELASKYEGIQTLKEAKALRERMEAEGIAVDDSSIAALETGESIAQKTDTGDKSLVENAALARKSLQSALDNAYMERAIDMRGEAYKAHDYATSLRCYKTHREEYDNAVATFLTGDELLNTGAAESAYTQYKNASMLFKAITIASNSRRSQTLDAIKAVEARIEESRIAALQQDIDAPLDPSIDTPGIEEAGTVLLEEDVFEPVPNTGISDTLGGKDSIEGAIEDSGTNIEE